MKSIGNIRKNTQTGFTMVEVIVAALVFALATAGIFATISSLTNPAEESKEDVTAAFVGKKILDNWRSQISTDNWDDRPFNETGTGWHEVSAEDIDGVMYYGAYITEAVSGSNAVKVTLNVCWPNKCL